MTEPPVATAADGTVPELVYVESSSSSESNVRGVEEESESVFTETEMDGVGFSVAAALVVVTVANVVGKIGGFALELGEEAGAEEPADGLAT